LAEEYSRPYFLIAGHPLRGACTIAFLIDVANAFRATTSPLPRCEISPRNLQFL
jgi:hypothetical protein